MAVTRHLTKRQKDFLKLIRNYKGDSDGWVSSPRGFTQATLDSLENKNMLEYNDNTTGTPYLKIRLTKKGARIANNLK